MHKKLLILAAVAAVAGCSEKEQTPALACTHPSVLQNVRADIEETVKQQAKSFARTDSRQFVDADKVIAAAVGLETALDNPQQTEEGGSPVCRADLRISIPEDTWRSAEAGSPLIYGNTPLSEWIAQKTMGSRLKFADRTFTTTLLYTPDQTGRAAYSDNTVSLTAQTLSAALLPYGIKSIVVIDGKPVKKEDAVKMLQNQSETEPPQADPQDILENNSASAVEGIPVALENEMPTEILRPQQTARQESAIAQSDLEQAREQYRQADMEINRIWKQMDRDVQQQLLTEQREWVFGKKNNCLQAAGDASDADQSEYLRLQCEARMTRERTQYLRGYAIE